MNARLSCCKDNPSISYTPLAPSIQLDLREQREEAHTHAGAFQEVNPPAKGPAGGGFAARVTPIVSRQLKARNVPGASGAPRDGRLDIVLSLGHIEAGGGGAARRPPPPFPRGAPRFRTERRQPCTSSCV